jgi:hypothetical protein
MMNHSQRASRLGLIWLLFVLEVLLFSFWRNSLGPYWSPVALVCIGFLLCGLSARSLTGYHLRLPAVPGLPGFLSRLLAGGGVLLAGFLLTGPVVRKALGQVPVATIGPISDVVPALQIYVTRFLGGETVYQSISMFGYTFLPNYLPLHWLPFVGAEVLGIDYRWWAYLSLMLGLLTYYWTLARLRLGWPEWLLKAALPVLVLHFMTMVERPLFSHGVEGLYLAFYLVLATSLLSNSAALRAVGIVLCLMSRYSFALWLPLYGVLLLWENPRKAWRTIGIAAVLALVLLVPFLYHDPTIILRAQLENFDIALGEWQHLEGNPLVPRHLFNGIGLAPWFYDMPGSLGERIIRLQTVHLVACASLMIFCGLLFWRYRCRFDVRLAALLSLKAYLVLFYALLIVPYATLSIISLGMSLFVVLFATAVGPGTVLAPLDALLEPDSGAERPQP